MPTLRDVAKLAGVDPSTASRVLNREPSAEARTAKQYRVLDAAHTLGYKTNMLARGLRTKRTGSLGMVIPDISNFVYSEIIKGAEQEARLAGYSLLLMVNEGGSGDSEAILRVFFENRVDGVILANALVEDQTLDALERPETPYVLVNRRSEKAQRFVVADDAGGAELAMRHLISVGHRRIAHLAGPLQAETARLRLKGYQVALAEADIPFDPELIIEGNYTTDSGAVGFEALRRLRTPPTAVFASNMLVAAGLLQAAHASGVSVPGELSVIALHDTQLAGVFSPGLTTVRMPLEEMGREAVQMLLRLLRKEEGPQQIVLPQKELVVRQSVASIGSSRESLPATYFGRPERDTDPMDR